MGSRVVGQQEADLVQLDQLPDGAVANAQLGQELQRLGDDLLGATPVLEVGDSVKRTDKDKPQSPGAGWSC